MKRTVAYIFIVLFFAHLDMSYADEAQKPSLKSMTEMKMEGIDKQTLDYSCGAAALSILLTNYFNDPYDENTLLGDILSRLDQKEVVLRMKDGFSLLDLKQLSERLGYRATGVKIPYQAAEELEGPVIILLKNNELHHFVVLKGARGGRAFIADPIKGHYKIPYFELQKQWEGETLILERADVGLPKEHKLAIRFNGAFPEENAVRALRNTPMNQRSRQ